MSYAILPALRVKDAAEKALAEIQSARRNAERSGGTRDQNWFDGLIGLCRAVLADPKGDHDVAVEASDFAFIMEHYDFTDPRLMAQHEFAGGMRRVGRD